MYGDQTAKEAEVARFVGGGLIPRRMTIAENIKIRIQDLEEQLKDARELRELMESEPKMSRAIELLGKRGIF